MISFQYNEVSSKCRVCFVSGAVVISIFMFSITYRVFARVLPKEILGVYVVSRGSFNRVTPFLQGERARF